ncbi:MAG: hypothetical protein JO187_03925, partial [Acidobacteria bacterium]|nr:hypothetical protein [Acidobacteriota bacterium]
MRVISKDGFSRYLTVANTRQWLYMAWTFRNFSQLPETVLSTGQRRLLDRMCRNGLANRRVNLSELIGTFELPTKSCEELFRNAVEASGTSKSQPGQDAQTVAVPGIEHTAAERSVPREAAVEPLHAPRRRSGHRTAAAICVLVLVGAAFAWQRFAQTGHVLPAGTIPALARLTQITAAAAQTTEPARPSTPAARAEESATTVNAAVTPEVKPDTPRAEATPVPMSQGAPAAVSIPAVSEPAKVAELHTPRVTPPAAEVKPAENTSAAVLSIDSLHQTARPQRLIY